MKEFTRNLKCLFFYTKGEVDQMIVYRDGTMIIFLRGGGQIRGRFTEFLHGTTNEIMSPIELGCKPELSLTEAEAHTLVLQLVKLGWINSSLVDLVINDLLGTSYYYPDNNDYLCLEHAVRMIELGKVIIADAIGCEKLMNSLSELGFIACAIPTSSVPKDGKLSFSVSLKSSE